MSSSPQPETKTNSSIFAKIAKANPKAIAIAAIVQAAIGLAISSAAQSAVAANAVLAVVSFTFGGACFVWLAQGVTKRRESVQLAKKQQQGE